MSVLFTVVLPVFLILGYGYVVTWRGMLSDSAIDGIQRFAQNFALPVLLFQSIVKSPINVGEATGLVVAGVGTGLAGPSRDMLIKRAAPPGAREPQPARKGPAAVGGGGGGIYNP